MPTATATYPKLGQGPWRTLRARAAQTPTTKFTPTTVATFLDQTPQSAANNVVNPMQKLGLIDENGGLTDRGNKWRNDATYAEACQEILDAIYPPELAGFGTADGGPDKAQVTKWFLHQNFGDSNARQMANAYVMIAEKKVPVPEASDKETKPKAQTKSATGTAARATKSATNSASTEAATPVPATQAAQTLARPAIHLDFQIHIDANTKPDVVDQIFASMAKHLYPTA